MEHTLPLSSNSARRSNLSRIFGVTITTPPSIRSRCASLYTYSSKASSLCGRIDGMWMEAVGRFGCRRSMGRIFGRECSWWLLGRRFRVVWIRVCFPLPTSLSMVYWQCSRWSTLRCWFICEIQFSPHFYLAQRRFKTEIHRCHSRASIGWASRRAEAKTW